MPEREKFTICYRCNKCGRLCEGDTEPKFCTSCDGNQLISGWHTANLTKRQPGDVVNGLKLIGYNRHQGEWLCLCLFCMSEKVVHGRNLNSNKSCGCLRRSTLIVKEFDQIHKMVYCECNVCELFCSYSLTTGEPITCKSGCI